MAAVLKLLERQLGLWELQRRLKDVGNRPGRCLEGRVAYGPCLLVSRERGSGGGRVAHLVAEQLGWQVFDREVVDQIAQLAHVRQQFLETVDAETRAHWDQNWRPELKPEDIGYEQYLRCLREVVLTLGHHGDVIILGRGAQYMLPAQCALRVRFAAPLELRIERVMQDHNVSLAAAKAHVMEFDTARTDFVQRCFRRDPDSPLNYDLMLNTGELKIESALGLVLLALREKLGVVPAKK